MNKDVNKITGRESLQSIVALALTSVVERGFYW